MGGGRSFSRAVVECRVQAPCRGWRGRRRRIGEIRSGWERVSRSDAPARVWGAGQGYGKRRVARQARSGVVMDSRASGRRRAEGGQPSATWDCLAVPTEVEASFANRLARQASPSLAPAARSPALGCGFPVLLPTCHPHWQLHLHQTGMLVMPPPTRHIAVSPPPASSSRLLAWLARYLAMDASAGLSTECTCCPALLQCHHDLPTLPASGPRQPPAQPPPTHHGPRCVLSTFCCASDCGTGCTRSGR